MPAGVPIHLTLTEPSLLSASQPATNQPAPTPRLGAIENTPLPQGRRVKYDPQRSFRISPAGACMRAGCPRFVTSGLLGCLRHPWGPQTCVRSTSRFDLKQKFFNPLFSLLFFNCSSSCPLFESVWKAPPLPNI